MKTSDRGAGRTLLVLVVFLLLAGTIDARAQTGSLRGTVTDVESGEPLPFANVVIKEIGWGVATKEDGTFVIREIAPGSYTVLATYVGYDQGTSPVVIEAGRTAEISMGLETSASEVPEVTVFGDRSLVDVRNTSSVKTLSSQDIEDLTIEPTIDSVIQQQAGVTVRDGEIHIRGGRSDETLLMVDGVALRDATGGNTLSKSLSAGSAAEVTVVKGGWDAKFGQAISGVVDVRVKEGTPRFTGRLAYQTDTITGNENTHYGNFQLNGPVPLIRSIANVFGFDRAQVPTFHLDLSGEISDTYLPSIRDVGDGSSRLQSSYQGSFLGRVFNYGDFFRPNGDNNWRLTFKSGWNFHPRHKIAFTYIKSIAFTEDFQAHDIADVNRNITTYPWAWSRRLDHHYTIARDFYSMALAWKHTLGDQTWHEVRLKNSFNNTRRDVAGKNWVDYSSPQDGFLDELGVGHPFFVDTGDASDYRDRFTELFGVDWNLNSRSEHHDISLGLSANYEDVQYFSLNSRTVEVPDEPLGQEFDLFHVFPGTGSAYFQDRIEYPGINLKLGMRADVFLPGEQVERLYEDKNRPGFDDATAAEWDANTNEIFGRRYKVRWSPRVAISHPISDRSHLFFNFGRFTQWPTYFFLYAKTGGISSEEFPRVGNPNLEPEVSAQYEFGAGHKFTNWFSFRATVFFKDIYDYPTSLPVEVATRTTRRQTFFLYRNVDYARSRGFEIELQKRRKKHTFFSASYSFSVATGKSSDPSGLKVVQALGGDARETPLEEEFMWWNRPHKVTLSAGYQVDADQRPPTIFGMSLFKDWKLSFFWLLQSGESYTPTSAESDAELQKAFSANGPVDSVFDFDFHKYFRVGGQRFTFSVVGRNLLNHRTVLEIDSATGITPRAGVGSSWTSSPQSLYLNQLAVRSGNADPGAFRSENDAVIRTMTSVLNPAYVAAPRTIRMGMSYEF